MVRGDLHLISIWGIGRSPVVIEAVEPPTTVRSFKMRITLDLYRSMCYSIGGRPGGKKSSKVCGIERLSMVSHSLRYVKLV